MLKSLFFKPKSKTDELLPPPPPFPSMELEAEESAIDMKREPSAALFDGLFSEPEAKKGKAANKKPEFEDLLSGLDSGMPEKLKGKSKPGIENDVLDELFKDAIAETKASRKTKKGSRKSTKKRKGRGRTIEKDILKKLGIDSISPEKIEPLKDFEFPENLENIDIEAEMRELNDAPGQHNISQNAEKEIMEAIGQAKSGKPRFMDVLKQKLSFTRKKRKETDAKVFDVPEENKAFASGIEEIQIKIDDARNALMDFRLKQAKTFYIEIISLYNQLKPEEKAKVYNEINDLYLERKSAEQLRA